MKQNISEAELEVMKVLWQMKNATSAEIIEVLKIKVIGSQKQSKHLSQD